MARTLTVPVAHLDIRLRPIFLGLLLPAALIAGLLFMHVLTVTPSGGYAHEDTHGMVAGVGTAISVLSDSEDGGAVAVTHAGRMCLSSATKFVGISPAVDKPVRTAPLPGPVGIALPEARGDGTSPSSLCVLRR